MKTTQEWLAQIKADPKKMKRWLQRQYVGEVLAAARIASLVKVAPSDCKAWLRTIASDESRHAVWVKGLLISRNIKPVKPTYRNTRYWKPILGKRYSFEEVAAIGHHAETMRLRRIKALASDTEIDQDIRDVFKKILPDEKFHADSFAAMSTAEDIKTMRDLHQVGLAMLGLTDE